MVERHLSEFDRLLADLAESTAADADVVKAFGQMLDILKSQGGRINLLEARLGNLTQDVRRTEKTAKAAAKSAEQQEPKEVTVEEFFNKALALQATTGEVNGHEIQLAEYAVNHGQEIPPEIVRKVLG